MHDVYWDNNSWTLTMLTPNFKKKKQGFKYQS